MSNITRILDVMARGEGHAAEPQLVYSEPRRPAAHKMASEDPN
jgi:hypothetical protein